MDAKTIVTRRSMLVKGMAAGVAALGLSALLRPGTTLAVDTTRPPTKQDPDREYYMKVFYDRMGNCVKVCYYDKDGSLVYCDYSC